MPLTPADVIPDAIGLAYPYVVESATARGPLLRKLFMLEGKICNFYATTSPERISISGGDTLVTNSLNQSGYSLHVARAYLNFKYTDASGLVLPISMQSAYSPRAPAHPAGIVRGAFMFPFDPFDTQWTGQSGSRPFFIGNGDSVGYEYVPEPVQVTSLTQMLISPDETRQYLIYELLLQVLQVSGAPMTRLQGTVQDRDGEWQALQLGAPRRTDVR